MNKILFTMILSVNVFGQINFSTFPKIGFGDMFWLANAPLYYNHQPDQPTYDNYLANSFYYPQLRDLGLNHIVTFGGAYDPTGEADFAEIPLDSTYNPTLKVLDVYFFMRLTRYDGSNPMFLGGVYAGAQGNTGLNEHYEVGGSTTTYDEDGNYGFGTPSLTSAWIKNPPAVGQFDATDGGKTVFLATTAASADTLLIAELHASYTEYREALLRKSCNKKGAD